MKEKKIKKISTISVSQYTNQCIGYTAKILGLSKTQLITQIFNIIIKEACLLKSDASMEISHDNGIVNLKFSGNPFCQFGTLTISTQATDKEIDKAVLEKVYGEKID